MKLPAVAIAVSFASGIVLGQSGSLQLRPSLQSHAASVVVVILVLLLLGFLLTRRNFIWAATIASIASWIALGLLAISIADMPLPADHVLVRFATQQIPQKTPLRWSGTLRSEPSRLPWGFGLELDLTGVEMAEGVLPVCGGMRLGFTPSENDPALPELHTGDQITALAEAHLPLVYKDPGAFDRRAFLAQQNVHLLATLRASVLLEKTGTAPPTFRTRLARLRGVLRDHVDAMFPGSPQTSGILRAMLLGDRSFVDRAESVDFQKTGVFHVLVVAGLHVGALAYFLFWVSRKLRLGPAARTLFVLASLLAYVVIVEQRAPVLRAGLMAAIVIAGSFFYRRLDLLNSAAIAALVLLVANPTFVRDTGFQLSFLAIGAIAGLALPLIQRTVQPYLHALDGWRDVTRDASHPAAQAQFRMDVRDAIFALTTKFPCRYAKWIQDTLARSARGTLRVAELFVLSFVLQLGMLPLMARDFHRISLLGPVVNLFAVPLTGVIVPLGFVSLASGAVLPVLGRLLAHPLAWLIYGQGRIVSFFAGIPYGSYRIPGPPAWVTELFFFVAILAIIQLRSARTADRWKAIEVALALSLTAAIIAIYPFQPTLSKGELEVTVLDVGQGDSILVVSPRGSTLLIDGGGAFEGFRGREEHLGPDPGEEAVSAYLWSRGFKRLEAVALSHGHQDHVGGLTAVLQNFHVGRLFVGRETAAPAFEKLKQVAHQVQVPIEHELRGQRFLWDGVQIDFLWPEIVPEEVAPQAKNNDSLVVRLHYGERTILLPGDAEKQVEYTMLSENDPATLHADVLKVGHHGSKNSTMPQFLDAVSPQISIISAGEENPYGHPSPELLQRLQESGTWTLRTDEDGAIQILTNGHALCVSCFRECKKPAVESGMAHPPNQDQQSQQ